MSHPTRQALRMASRGAGAPFDSAQDGQGRRGERPLVLFLFICILMFAGCQERQIRIHFENAEKHRVAGDMAAAADEYRAVIALDSTEVDAQNNLGYLLAKMGKADSALYHYRRALSTDPSFAGAHYNKGVLFAGTGQIDSAVASYKAAINNDSTQVEAYNNLGVLFEGLGKVHSAIDQYSLAVKRHPDFAPAHANLGRALFLTGRHDEAIEACHKAVELRPSLVGPYVTLGSAYAQRNDFEKSIQFLEQASRIAPDDALVSGNLRHVRDLKSQHADSRASGEMRAAHIVVANEDFAAVLLDQIRKGEDFATLARTHSIDPSRTSGGDIGAFRRGDLMPAFEQLVSRLTPGEVGGPLKTPLGYHLIKRIY